MNNENNTKQLLRSYVDILLVDRDICLSNDPDIATHPRKELAKNIIKLIRTKLDLIEKELI